MGFERACAVIECTKGGVLFDGAVSNYDTEVFQPIIRKLQEMSGASYTPGQSSDESSIALRVCADHIRMISFSIADGAIPSSDGRGYVVRRLLRRASRYGRKLGLLEPFLYKLVQVLADTMGDTFPELREQQSKVEMLIQAEEKSFNQTLDRGLHLFEGEAENLPQGGTFPGDVAFKLYDTYGFPLDLTQAMARERDMTVDEPRFQELMDEQRQRARSAQHKVVVTAEDRELELPATPFSGFAVTEESTRVAAVIDHPEQLAVVLDSTPFYAEKGGQRGDTGYLTIGGQKFEVVDTRHQEGVIFHLLTPGQKHEAISEGASALAVVDRARRRQIERHHTATHLLHHALREVLGKDVRQQGSLVAPDRLRFDFTYFQQVKASELATIEKMVNEMILENNGVSYFEIPYTEKPDSIIAFFGDKYGETVRVVKIGGRGTGALDTPIFDGYSMELCGGTHTRHTGELGYLSIAAESAIASGVRRLEAVSGSSFMDRYHSEQELLGNLSGLLSCAPGELEKKVTQMLEHSKELEKKLRAASQSEASTLAQSLLKSQKTVGDIPVIVESVDNGSPEQLRLLADGLRDTFEGIAVFGSATDGKVSLLVSVSPEWVKKGFHAGKLIKELAGKVGGSGGGRPDLAQAGGKDPSKLPGALSSVEELLKN
jgi:alanyl-tRNA synthetase